MGFGPRAVARASHWSASNPVRSEAPPRDDAARAGDARTEAGELGGARRPLLSVRSPSRRAILARRVIKYLGSKRTLVPAIVEAVAGLRGEPGTVLDLFSGTSRVGHALKRAGWRV